MVVQLITGNTNPENVTFLMPRVTVLPVRPRRWLPRDIDPLTLIDRVLAFICYRLNNTLRKCLGYKTPTDVFRQKLFANRHRYA